MEINPLVAAILELKNETKLDQFRRHPDWVAALSRCWEKHRESSLFVTLEDGRRGVHSENLLVLRELADQEFIDAIIRQTTTSSA